MTEKILKITGPERRTCYITYGSVKNIPLFTIFTNNTKIYTYEFDRASLNQDLCIAT